MWFPIPYNDEVFWSFESVFDVKITTSISCKPRAIKIKTLQHSIDEAGIFLEYLRLPLSTYFDLFVVVFYLWYCSRGLETFLLKFVKFLWTVQALNLEYLIDMGLTEKKIIAKVQAVVLI